MKKFKNNLIVDILAISFVFCLAGPITVFAVSPAVVNLGTAGNFVILSKTGISTTGTTSITGDIGVSPIAASAITGFALTLPATGAFSTSSLVTGKVYASDYANPTPADLTTAVLDMQTAYTDAMGRAPDVTELGAGNIGGLTLSSGVYKWGTGLIIPTDVTLTGSANDIWIFQVAQNLNVSSAAKIVLAGGAKASNIFWVVAGQTTIGTTAVFNGIILDQTAIVLNTGATLNGRALAQTAVTLDSNIVTAPISSYVPPVVITPTCSNLYWFDNASNQCQSAKQFCGSYMYYGLQTFDNLQNCLSAFNTLKVNCTPNWTCGWGSCTNGYQTQVAIDSNNCGLSSSNASIACTALAKTCDVLTPITSTDRTLSIARLIEQINGLQGQINILNSANTGFNRNLFFGMTGNDVKELQVWLNTHGYLVASSGPGSSGNETTTFGGLTRSALARFQVKVGINPPIGNFGPITRAYLATNY